MSCSPCATEAQHRRSRTARGLRYSAFPGAHALFVLANFESPRPDRFSQAGFAKSTRRHEHEAGLRILSRRHGPTDPDGLTRQRSHAMTSKKATVAVSTQPPPNLI